MNSLSCFLDLISKTEGRDKVLRLIQYSCLYSVAQERKGPAFNIYQQMRMTRKLLRFLRTLEYSSKIRAEIPKVKENIKNMPNLLKYLTSILQNIFTILFFLSDHRVCLSELNVISKEAHAVYYPKSMKYYFLQNLFGVINDVLNMAIIAMENKNSYNLEEAIKSMKHYSFDLIKCLFDCIVAIFYWKGGLEAKKIGVLGVITSLMAIMQSLNKI